MSATANSSPADHQAASLPPTVAEAEEYWEEEDADPRRAFLLFQAAPAWLISMLLHLLILLTLGLVTIADPIQIVNVLTANVIGEAGPEIEEFTIEAIDPGDVADLEKAAEPVDMASEMELAEPTLVESMEVATVLVDMADLSAEMAPTDTTIQSLSSMSIQPLDSRGSAMKESLLREYGGTESSESAVRDALHWLSRHQLPNGAWTFRHNLVCKGACGDPGQPNRARAFNAATSLALLPFLGAGQTHVEGEFKDLVFRGLRFLIQNGRKGAHRGMPMLDLSEDAGNMYSHGLAAITLCEAYAMTQDPELAEPAQAALNYIVFAQGPDGGWRYLPKAPTGGDTSVTGWQVMALKSGYMGHLNVPPRTFQRSMLFLDKVQSEQGSLYGYRWPDDIRHSCVAIGLLCRMYTGWDKSHPGIVRGAKELSEIGVLKRDIYYDYYAAQVLRHYGGAEWNKFNIELRDWLVATQAKRLGEKGSWHFHDHERHRGPVEGGRLASTAFATMILEVYYRHMPLYADEAADEEFPL